MAPHCIHAVANTERIRELENQVMALMFTRKLKIQADDKLAKQRAQIRDLQKFDVAQIRIRQLELEPERYFKKAVERFNRCEKESGLPTLSPGQPVGSDPQAIAGGTESPGQPARAISRP